MQDVEEINFSNGKLYIDAVSGTAGTTQVSNTLLGFSLDIKTGVVPVFTGDGEKYFSFTKNIGPEVSLDLTLEHDSNGVSVFDDFQAETPKQYRLKFEGSNLTTSGTTYSKKTLIIDIVGKVVNVSAPEDRDGDTVITATIQGAYNSTAAKFAEIIVVNENATLA